MKGRAAEGVFGAFAPDDGVGNVGAGPEVEIEEAGVGDPAPFDLQRQPEPLITITSGTTRTGRRAIKAPGASSSASSTRLDGAHRRPPLAAALRGSAQIRFPPGSDCRRWKIDAYALLVLSISVSTRQRLASFCGAT